MFPNQFLSFEISGFMLGHTLVYNILSLYTVIYHVYKIIRMHIYIVRVVIPAICVCTSDLQSVFSSITVLY